MKIKVLFDRSVFHGNKFEKLKSCFNDNKHLNTTLSIYGNPILFEETLGLLYKKNEIKLKSHLRLILDITNSRWFRNDSEIWPLELSVSTRKNKYFFMSSSEVNYLKNNLIEKIIINNIDYDQLKGVIDESNVQRTKSNNIRELCKNMRLKASKTAKEKGRSVKQIKESFGDYLKNNIDFAGEQIIQKHVGGLSNKEKVISDWKKRKNIYPYFTQWVKLFLYIPFHAMVNQNEKIDKNAMLDISQLALLQKIDIFVSDDNSFMRSAFNQVYNANKKFMNLHEFIEFTEEMKFQYL